MIGKTTSCAGVWLSDQNRLIDNSIMRAAETAQLDEAIAPLKKSMAAKPVTLPKPVEYLRPIRLK